MIKLDRKICPVVIESTLRSPGVEGIGFFEELLRKK